MSKVFEDFVGFIDSTPTPLSIEGFGLVESAGDPSLFRVAFPIDRDGTVKQLKAGKLEGMVGISETREIRFSWFGPRRNALLIMKANKVLNDNDIEPIEYDNTKLLLKNDMEMLKRCLDTDDRRTALSSILDHTAGYMVSKGERDNSWALGGTSYPLAVYLSKSPVTTLGNLVDKILDYFEQDEVQKDKELKELSEISEFSWIAWLKGGILRFGETFAREKEWVIRDATLRVPTGSAIIVLVSWINIPRNIENMIKKNPDITLASVLGSSGVLLSQQEQEFYKMKSLVSELGGRYRLKFLMKKDWESQINKNNIRRERRFKSF